MNRRTAIAVMVVALALAGVVGAIAVLLGSAILFIPAGLLLGIGLWSTTQARPDRTSREEPQ